VGGWGGIRKQPVSYIVQDFRRRLIANKWDQWVNLCQRLMEINLNENQDRFVWALTSSGKFTVKSMYGDMMNGHT
jgi:hypothetical protein